MVYKNEQALGADLRAGKLERVYLLYGRDEYLKERYAGLILDRAVPEKQRDFDFQRMDGRRLSMDALYDSVLTLPLMATHRCILVDDPEVDKLTAVDVKKLHQILEEVEEGTVVILLIRQSPFLPKKSAKCRSLLELVGKLGGVAELNERSQTDLVKFLRSRLEKAGCELSAADAQYLIERTSRELLTLTAEADKLAAYCGPGGKVTREVIQRVCPATVEGEVFDLSKAILRGDYPGAMHILGNLLYLREPEINILYTLSYAFVDLYRAKVARHTGVEQAQIVAAFDYKGRDFRVRNALRDSSRCSLTFLKKSLELLADADYRLKSSRTEPRIILEQTVTAIFVALQSEGRH